MRWGLVTCVNEATLWLRLNVAWRSQVLFLLWSDWSENLWDCAHSHTWLHPDLSSWHHLAILWLYDNVLMLLRLLNYGRTWCLNLKLCDGVFWWNGHFLHQRLLSKLLEIELLWMSLLLHFHRWSNLIHHRAQTRCFYFDWFFNNFDCFSYNTWELKNWNFCLNWFLQYLKTTDSTRWISKIHCARSNLNASVSSHGYLCRVCSWVYHINCTLTHCSCWLSCTLVESNWAHVDSYRSHIDSYRARVYFIFSFTRMNLSASLRRCVNIDIEFLARAHSEAKYSLHFLLDTYRASVYFNFSFTRMNLSASFRGCVNIDIDFLARAHSEAKYPLHFLLDINCDWLTPALHIVVTEIIISFRIWALMCVHI